MSANEHSIGQDNVEDGYCLAWFFFQYALDVFNATCNIDALFVTTNASAPHTMKTLAKCYFGVIEKDHVPRCSLSPRQPVGLQTKLLRHVDIVDFGLTFNEGLCVFNTSMETNLLSDPSEIPALTHEETGRYIFHTGVPFFSIPKPCLACSRVFAGDIYGDLDVSCDGKLGIKHRHNIVRDTVVDICYRSRISAGGGLDVCMDMTGSSPLTQTWMADFMPGRTVIDAPERKRVKCEAKCMNIEYESLPFSFSSLRELGDDVVTLLKRI
nr:ABC transporter A family member 9-like [Tanacetum cinerariifolium]